MAPHPKITDIVRSGKIVAGAALPLSYVVLAGGEVLIHRGSLLKYLEIEQSSDLLLNGLLPATVCRIYLSDDLTEELGVSPVEVPAFCLNVIEQNNRTGAYRMEAMNAMMLLLFLSSSFIKSIIELESIPIKAPDVPVVPITGHLN